MGHSPGASKQDHARHVRRCGFGRARRRSCDRGPVSIVDPETRKHFRGPDRRVQRTTCGASDPIVPVEVVVGLRRRYAPSQGCASRALLRREDNLRYPPVAAPSLGAHDRAAVLAAQFSQLRKACGERRRQGIVGIVPKAPYPPIGVRRRFYISRLSSKTAKRGDMFIADLPRRASVSGRLSSLNCGLVRDRGIDRTSTTRSTRDSRSRSTNSAIVLVEWPMVKNVFVSAPVTWRTRSIAKASPQNYGQNTLFQTGL